MRNNIHSKAIALLVSVFFSMNLVSQNVLWTNIKQDVHGARSITINPDNSILQTIRRGGENDLIKYDSDGNTVWTKDICDCTSGHFESYHIPGDSLFHITVQGDFYISDSEVTEVIYKGNMLQDIVDKDSVEYEYVYSSYETMKGLICHGAVRDPGKEFQVATFINYSPFEISTDTIQGNNFFVSDTYLNDKTGERVELSVFFHPNWSRTYKYSTYDLNHDLISENQLDSVSVSINDIRKYNSEGILELNKTYLPENDDDILFFEETLLSDNELIVAGTIGVSLGLAFDLDFYLLGVDIETGNINWKLRHEFIYYGTTVRDISFISENQLIVTGATGLDDAEHDGVSFLMKISTGLSDIESISSSDILLGPNPTDGLIRLVDHKQEIKSVEVYDNQSKLILSQKNSNDVDLSGYASGMYTIKLTSDQGITTKKVIKQ